MPIPSRTGGLRRGRRQVLSRQRRTRQQGAVRLVALVALTLAVAVCHTAVVTGALFSGESSMGRRSRLGMSSTLLSLPEADFRLLFRMSRPDVFSLLDIVRGGLEVDEGMAVLATGQPIPADCRLALALRILAGASYLDCMLAFGVGRCTVFNIFHQVRRGLLFGQLCVVRHCCVYMKGRPRPTLCIAWLRF